MPTNKEGYMAEYRAKKKMEAKKRKEQQASIPIADCVKFMDMLRGRTQRDTIFMDAHFKMCGDCRQRYHEHKQEKKGQNWEEESKLGADMWHDSSGPKKKEKTDMVTADDFMKEYLDDANDNK